MKQLYITLLASVLIFSCNKYEPENIIEEDIYNTTKKFKTKFIFIVDKHYSNINWYKVMVDRWQNDPCCWEKSTFNSLYDIEGDTMIIEPKSYLNDEVLVTIQVMYKDGSSPRGRLYKPDTFHFKSIKDTILYIHYPQDTLNF